MWLGETYLPILWLRGCNYSDNLDGRGLGNGRLGPDISSNQSDEDISRAWGLMPVNTPSHDHALAPGQVMTAWVTRGRISREFYRTHKTMAQLWLALPCHGDNMRGPTRQRHILSIRWMLISTTSDSFPFPVSFLYPRCCIVYSDQFSSSSQMSTWWLNDSLLSVLGYYSHYWLSSLSPDSWKSVSIISIFQSGLPEGVNTKPN